MTKPESYAQPPEIHYAENFKSYKNSTRLQKIQAELTQSALDILSEKTNRDNINNKKDGVSLVLDLGCGTGMSGRQISKNGYLWIGCDISKEMLSAISESIEIESNGDGNNDDDLEFYPDTSSEKNEYVDSMIENDEKNNIKDGVPLEIENGYINEVNAQPLAKLCLDIANELPFKPGTFDHIISISCIQWLFHNRSIYEAKKSFLNLFNCCKSIIKLNGTAIFQWYGSSNKEHVDILMLSARKAGFFPEMIHVGLGRNKKTYLYLSTSFSKQKLSSGQQKKKKLFGVKARIIKMKERHKRKGHDVGPDSKFTGRKRSKKFK